MDIAISVNKTPIRLTAERWQHITTGHPELADYYYQILDAIENPNNVYAGNYGELIAVKLMEYPIGKYLIVVYKEVNASDGFIVTAYISRKQQQFQNKAMVWEHQK